MKIPSLKFWKTFTREQKDYVNKLKRERYQELKNCPSRKILIVKNRCRFLGIRDEETIRFITKRLLETMRCDICQGPPDGRWPEFHIDHDHRTGVFRGLLCHSCNMRLGAYERIVNNPVLLSRTQAYLRGELRILSGTVDTMECLPKATVVEEEASL